MAERNLCPNPAAGADLAGITAVLSTGPHTVTRPTALVGYDRVTGAIGTSTASGVGAWMEIRWAPHNPGGDLAGRSFTGTIQFRVSSPPDGSLYVRLAFLNAAGTPLDYATLTPTAAAGAIVRHTVVGTAPANTRQVGMWVRSERNNNGWTLNVTACRIDEIDDPGLAYGDGDTLGWGWDGAQHNSTSTRSAQVWPWFCQLINEPVIPAGP